MTLQLKKGMMGNSEMIRERVMERIYTLMVPDTKANGEII